MASQFVRWCGNNHLFFKTKLEIIVDFRSILSTVCISGEEVVKKYKQPAVQLDDRLDWEWDKVIDKKAQSRLCFFCLL